MKSRSSMLETLVVDRINARLGVERGFVATREPLKKSTVEGHQETRVSVMVASIGGEAISRAVKLEQIQLGIGIAKDVGFDRGEIDGFNTDLQRETVQEIVAALEQVTLTDPSSQRVFIPGLATIDPIEDHELLPAGIFYSAIEIVYQTEVVLTVL